MGVKVTVGEEGVSVEFPTRMTDDAYIAFPDDAALVDYNGMSGGLVVGRTPAFGVWKVSFLPSDPGLEGTTFIDLTDEETARAKFLKLKAELK